MMISLLNYERLKHLPFGDMQKDMVTRIFQNVCYAANASQQIIGL